MSLQGCLLDFPDAPDVGEERTSIRYSVDDTLLLTRERCQDLTRTAESPKSNACWFRVIRNRIALLNQVAQGDGLSTNHCKKGPLSFTPEG